MSPFVVNPRAEGGSRHRGGGASVVRSERDRRAAGLAGHCAHASRTAAAAANIRRDCRYCAQGTGFTDLYAWRHTHTRWHTYASIHTYNHKKNTFTHEKTHSHTHKHTTARVHLELLQTYDATVATALKVPNWPVVTHVGTHANTHTRARAPQHVRTNSSICPHTRPSIIYHNYQLVNSSKSN